MDDNKAPYWYKEAVLYELDVETFQDSNGDGVGDLPGLTSRLGYIKDLGATCVWLMPIFPTPNRDNGYDVSDYCAVDPRLGTLDDFAALVKEAGRLGLRVILDLPLNHTSDQHPWFQQAQLGKGNPYHDYYLWRDEPPERRGKGAFGGAKWTYDEKAGQYYFHNFYPFQPDLNVVNPAVREAFREILHFWLNFGVAGFRMDAVPFLIHQPGVSHPFTMLGEMHKFVRAQNPEAMLLGEANEPPKRLGNYFGSDEKGDHLDMLLNFYLCAHLFLGLAREQAEPIERGLNALPAPPEFGQYANFLRNNDELSLDQLTEEEKQAVYAVYAPREDMRAYGRGIRRRLAPMLGGNGPKLRLAHSLLLTLPGTPALYYGDEIGMGDDLSLPGRNSVRTTMQWTAGRGGGFSGAPEDTFPRGAIREGLFDYREVNVAAQQQDENSLLCWLRRALAARRQVSAFAHGPWQPLDTGHPAVLAHRCEGPDGAALALHNLGGEACQVQLDLGQLVEVFADREYAAPHPFDLGPYGYRWFQLGGGV